MADDFFKPYNDHHKRHVDSLTRAQTPDHAGIPPLEQPPPLRRTSSAPPAQDRIALPSQLQSTNSNGAANQAPMKMSWMALTKAHAERQALPLTIDTSGAKITTKTAASPETKIQEQASTESTEAGTQEQPNPTTTTKPAKTKPHIKARRKSSHTLFRSKTSPTTPISAVSPSTVCSFPTRSPLTPGATGRTPITPATTVSPSSTRLSRTGTLTFSLPSASPSSRRGSTYTSPLTGRKLSGITLSRGRSSGSNRAASAGGGDVAVAERGEVGSEGERQGFWGSKRMWQWFWAVVALGCTAGVAVAVVCWWFGV